MRKVLLALACALALAGTAVPSSAATSPTWAPAHKATVRPGSAVSTASGGCTTNFVFTEKYLDPAGRTRFHVLMGLAAHCFSLGSTTDTNACTAPTLPLGSAARIDGARYPATLVYSSWITAKKVRERDRNVCAVNDFALVRLDPRDHARVNPSLWHYGGPHHVRGRNVGFGDAVYTYGNSSLRFGVRQTSPKDGITTGTTHGGWNHQIYTATPGIPGDSGSAVLDEDGRGLGILVTLQAAPQPLSNGVTDLAKALKYANVKTGRDYRLASGTQGFRNPLLP